MLVSNESGEYQSDESTEKQRQKNPKDRMAPLAHETARGGVGLASLEGFKFALEILRPIRRRAISLLPISFKFGGHSQDANTLENRAATRGEKIKLAEPARAGSEPCGSTASVPSDRPGPRARRRRLRR